MEVPTQWQPATLALIAAAKSRWANLTFETPSDGRKRGEVYPRTAHGHKDPGQTSEGLFRRPAGEPEAHHRSGKPRRAARAGLRGLRRPARTHCLRADAPQPGRKGRGVPHLVGRDDPGRAAPELPDSARRDR